MDSILKSLTSLISSTKDPKLNKKLLSIQKKVEKVEFQEKRKKEKEDQKRRRETEKLLRSHFRKSTWARSANSRAIKQLEDENMIEVRHDTYKSKKYKIKNIGHKKSIEKFLKRVRYKVLQTLDKLTPSRDRYFLIITLQKKEVIKSRKQLKPLIEQFPIPSYGRTNENAQEREVHFDSLNEHFNKKLTELEVRESGWVLRSIDYLDLEQYRI